MVIKVHSLIIFVCQNRHSASQIYLLRGNKLVQVQLLEPIYECISVYFIIVIHSTIFFFLSFFNLKMIFQKEGLSFLMTRRD